MITRLLRTGTNGVVKYSKCVSGGRIVNLAGGKCYLGKGKIENDKNCSSFYGRVARDFCYKTTKPKKKQSRKQKRKEEDASKRQELENKKLRVKVNEWMKQLKDNVPYAYGIPMLAISYINLYHAYNVIDVEFHNPDFIRSMANLRASLICQNIMNVGFMAYMETIMLKYRPGRAKTSLDDKEAYYDFLLVPSFAFLGIDAILKIGNIYAYPMLIATQMVSMYYEGRATADGVMPYWYWALRFRMHFFLLFMFAFMGLNCYLYKQDKLKFPHKHNPKDGNGESGQN